MSTIGSARRYYLAKRQTAALRCEDIASVWQAKQEAEPGTALPADFPLLSRLTPLGYTTTEDLVGADSCELMEQGFSSSEAAEILAAIAS